MENSIEKMVNLECVGLGIWAENCPDDYSIREAQLISLTCYIASQNEGQRVQALFVSISVQ